MGLEERTQTAGPRPDRPHARVDWRQMVGVGVIASALGIAAGLLIDWFPVSASKEGEEDRHALGRPDHLLRPRLRRGHDGRPVLGAQVPDAPRRGEPRRAADPRQHAPGGDLDRDPRDHPGRPVHLRVRGARGRRGRRANPVKVRVVGEQFAWTFFYTGADGKEIAASRQLHVPIDRQVQFTLQSKDVLHDFWVPAFRIKKDAVPGIDVKYSRHAQPARRLPDRLRRAVRARARGDALQRRRAVPGGLRQVHLRSRQARRAGRRGGGGGAAPAEDGKTVFTRPTATARRATRSPTREPPARSARTSTPCSRARTRRSSSSRSSTRAR